MQRREDHHQTHRLRDRSGQKISRSRFPDLLPPPLRHWPVGSISHTSILSRRAHSALPQVAKCPTGDYSKRPTETWGHACMWTAGWTAPENCIEGLAAWLAWRLPSCAGLALVGPSVETPARVACAFHSLASLLSPHRYGAFSAFLGVVTPSTVEQPMES